MKANMFPVRTVNSPGTALLRWITVRTQRIVKETIADSIRFDQNRNPEYRQNPLKKSDMTDFLLKRLSELTFRLTERSPAVTALLLRRGQFQKPAGHQSLRVVRIPELHRVM